MAEHDVDLVEVKEAVENMRRGWEEFQAANDERLKQIEQNGAADPVTVDKLAKIEKDLAAYEDINQRLTQVADAQKAAKDEAEQAAKALEEEREALKGRVDGLETALKRAPRDPDDGKDPEVKAYEQAFWAYCRKDRQEMDANDLALLNEQKSLRLSDDTAGGYLAPAEYVREIIKGEVEFSPIRTIARVRTTSRNQVQIPKRTGTFSATWVAEQGTRSETTGLTYGLETVPTHESTALVDISEQMLEDSEFNLENELQMEFTEQFGVAEGAAFVNGNGVTRPEGFMTNGDVSSTNSGSAASIADSSGQANGLITLFHAVKTAYARNGRWTLNRATLGSARKLKDGNNNYIWQPGLASTLPATILGAPYVEATDMPDEAANAFPIAFGDFRRAYTIIDRVQMSILRDPFTQATSGNVRFIARRRVGGQVVLAEAIRKLKAAA